MRNRAFTLAEVLITLSIIGVVAALTIPSLVVNNQEKQTVVQLKKAYNLFSNAVALAQIDYGSIEGWGWEANASGAIKILDILAQYMNITRRCDGNTGCWSQNTKYNNGTSWAIDSWVNGIKGILADGMSFYIWSNPGPCTNNRGGGKLKNSCGAIGVDINGFKSPNTAGKDIFLFWITKEGIVPAGIKDDTTYTLSDCNKGLGVGCAAWVLINENMDYPPNGTSWEN